MAEHSIMLIGVPDSGKTNYIARLWEALRCGSGELVLIRATEIKFLEEMVAHLLQGEFAPRSSKSIEESRQEVTITLAPRGSQVEVDIVVPDVTGELWKKAVEDTELPIEWMQRLEVSSGALLFLRVLSDQNVQPLDWVTSRNLLRLTGNAAEAEESVPTQIFLSELLRFLQLKLRRRPDGSPARLSVVVTAWDRLDEVQRASSPFAFIESQFPLFAGRLEHLEGLALRVFGVSIVGGDLDLDKEFKKAYQDSDLANAGYTVFEENGAVIRSPDLTLPVNWLLKS